jgi:hypothetical protein
MKKRRLYLFLFFCTFGILVLTPQGFCKPLEDLVDAENIPVLSGEALNRVQYKNPSPLLVPKDPYVQGLAEGMIKALVPSFFVETLYLYKKPQGSSPLRWSVPEQTALYNQVLALSSLAGLQYYSHSRGEIRTFYESSTVVSGPDGKIPVDDPRYARPPGDLTIYARQKYLTFGDNIYKYEYHSRSDSLVFIQENLSSMNYGLVPAVGKNKLRSMVAVFDAGEYLLIYAVSMARAASIPGMGERVGRSFSARAEAILLWFSAQADKAFAAGG